MSLAAALITSASQDGPFLDITLVAPTLAIVVAILTLLTAPLMYVVEFRSRMSTFLIWSIQDCPRDSLTWGVLHVHDNLRDPMAW
jgi:hypothetical protein